MLEKIKKFVKNVPSTTWIVLAIGVVAFVVLSLANGSGKAPEAKPAVHSTVEAPASK